MIRDLKHSSGQWRKRLGSVGLRRDDPVRPLATTANYSNFASNLALKRIEVQVIVRQQSLCRLHLRIRAMPYRLMRSGGGRAYLWRRAGL